MHILALVPGGIGDQILFFPTLATLKQCDPNGVIDVVVEPRAQTAYQVCPSVRGVIPFDFKGKNSLADWGNLIGQMRDRYADGVVSLGSSWGVGFFLWLTGIPVRVGYGTSSLSRWFLTNPVALNSGQYAAVMYHDLLQGLGVTAPCPPLALAIPPDDQEWATQQQQRLGIGTGQYVLIHGGSSALAQTKGIDKIYPAHSWQLIIQDLHKRQMPVVLVQGPEDAAIVAALVEACPALKVTRPNTIGQLAAMIAGATLMMCTDSAPMHLSVAVQTRTIALFGPTDPQKLLPMGDRYTGIKSSTGRMADIAPDTVLQHVWG